MTTSPKVLIIDDEDRFRNTMRKLLTVRGLEVASVGSGKEALEKMGTEQYDVAILDVRMPEMTGPQVLAEMRKIAPDIEVIIMTGYASVDTAKEIIRLGAYDYMLKPYTIDELLEKIEAAYDRKIARKRLTGPSTAKPPSSE